MTSSGGMSWARGALAAMLAGSCASCSAQSSESTNGVEGALRLARQVEVNGFTTGGLEAFVGGAWGAVCTSNFDNTDALVACRQLGFDTGIHLLHVAEPLFQRSPGGNVRRAPHVLEALDCSGDEARLVDCPTADPADPYDYPDDYGFYDTSTVRCDPARDTNAFVACGNADGGGEEGDLRLVGGEARQDGSAEYGRLEFFQKGGWGTICNNFATNRFRSTPLFSSGAIDVACRQLGFAEGFQIQVLEDADADVTERAPIVLAGGSCSGSEARLEDCAGIDVGRVGGRCSHSSDQHVVCFNGETPEMDGQLRLQGGDSGSGFAYGRLEVFLRGFWSNVCNDNRFTPDSAVVACQVLGFDGGAALRFIDPDTDMLRQVLFANIPVGLAAVDCDGGEASLLECQNNDRLVGRCTSLTSSTVLACADSASDCALQPGSEEGAVRLRGGSGTPCDPLHSGFVEVFRGGEWGPICVSQLSIEQTVDNLVAGVVCQQLGFPHGTPVDPLTARDAVDYFFTDTYYYSYAFQYDDTAVEEAEEPVGRFLLSSPECSGLEDRLLECNLGEGFLSDDSSCPSQPVRLHVACRQFPVAEAGEGGASPGGGDEDDAGSGGYGRVDDPVA